MMQMFLKELLKAETRLCPLPTQVSYGKGPDYFRLKTAILPTSMFLLLISMKFGTELENYQYDSFK